jgi:murein DD-endopeptidase MepM/ murein hydrolase activator NlpD
MAQQGSNSYFDNLRRRQLGKPLDLRAPEEQFSSDRDVKLRCGQPIVSNEVEDAISSYFQALDQGDEYGVRQSANEMKDRTRAHFQRQGVPVFAHPVLPPQFVQGVAAMVRHLPDSDRRLEIDNLAGQSGPDLKASVARELVLGLAAIPSAAPARAPATGGRNREIRHAPTWVPQTTFLEDVGDYLFPKSPRVRWNEGEPVPVDNTRRNGDAWDRELFARARLGGENRAAQAAWGKVIQTPDEKLTKDVIAGQPRGREPIFLSGKEAHPDDPYKDRVSWPVEPEVGDNNVVVRSPYGPRVRNNRLEFHVGVDYRSRLAPPGGPVFSPMNGTILRIEENSAEGGNQIFILHDDGSISGFSHTRVLKGLQEGDEVYVGQQIGNSDGSGTKAPDGKPAPHTHHSYYPPGTPIDPLTLKPIAGRDARDVNAPARLQKDPLERFRLLRNAKPLNPEGYTGRTPMRVERGP